MKISKQISDRYPFTIDVDQTEIHFTLDQNTGSTATSPGLSSSVPSTTPKTNQPSLKPVRWKPRMDNEKSIKEVFRFVGNWRLESEGLFIWRRADDEADSGIHTTKDLVGDFSMKMSARVVLQPNMIYQIRITACGETFLINDEGNLLVSLERKDGKLTLNCGNSRPKTIMIKDANLTKPTNIGILCSRDRPNSGKSEILIGGLEIVGRTPANGTP